MKKREKRENNLENREKNHINVKSNLKCENCYYYQHDYCYCPPFVECIYFDE